MAKRQELPPFSRIAYRNLGNDRLIVERLNRELETWIRSKNGVDDLIDRIRRVTGMSYNQAKRVAQTERTRVLGQARHEAIRSSTARWATAASTARSGSPARTTKPATPTRS